MKGREWNAISHHLGKRKREGKQTDLYVDGVLIPKKKVQKESSRNDFIPALEKYTRGNIFFYRAKILIQVFCSTEPYIASWSDRSHSYIFRRGHVFTRKSSLVSI